VIVAVVLKKIEPSNYRSSGFIFVFCNQFIKESCSEIEQIIYDKKVDK